MAKVIITITDTEDGGADMRIQSDPPFKNPNHVKEEDMATTYTNAQIMGFTAAQAIHESTGARGKLQAVEGSETDDGPISRVEF